MFGGVVSEMEIRERGVLNQSVIASARHAEHDGYPGAICRARSAVYRAECQSTAEYRVTVALNCASTTIRLAGHDPPGGMAEWPNALVLKTSVPQGTGSSNLPPSA